MKLETGAGKNITTPNIANLEDAEWLKVGKHFV